jgi:hypothetical protein
MASTDELEPSVFSELDQYTIFQPTSHPASTIQPTTEQASIDPMLDLSSIDGTAVSIANGMAFDMGGQLNSNLFASGFDTAMSSIDPMEDNFRGRPATIQGSSPHVPRSYSEPPGNSSLGPYFVDASPISDDASFFDAAPSANPSPAIVFQRQNYDGTPVDIDHAAEGGLVNRAKIKMKPGRVPSRRHRAQPYARQGHVKTSKPPATRFQNQRASTEEPQSVGSDQWRAEARPPEQPDSHDAIVMRLMGLEQKTQREISKLFYAKQAKPGDDDQEVLR